MFRSTVCILALAVLAFSPQLFAQPLTIDTGNSTWSVGRVQQPLQASGGTGPYVWSIIGTLPPGITLRTDLPPGFPPQASAGLIGLATEAGSKTFTLQVTSGGDTVTKEVTMKIVSLAIQDPGNLPDGFALRPYSYTFTHAGPDPVTWSMPAHAWLSIDPATGVLSGTPTTAGYYNFSVSVSDGIDTISSGFAINVSKLRVTTSRILPNGTQYVGYPAFNFTADGNVGTVSWDLQSSPPVPGLWLQPDGTLTGTPNSAGSWWFPVTATDSADGSFYRAWYHLTVVAAPPSLPAITTMQGALNDLSLGVPAQVGFSANGGIAPYDWSAAGLPPGMSLVTGALVPSSMDPAGAVVSGAPTELGSHQVTLSATDHSTPPVTISRTFTLNVTAMVSDTGPIPYGTRGVPYPPTTLRTIGGKLPYAWAITSGALPAGLTLNGGTGVVSGTPLENTQQCPQIQVTDADTPAKTFKTSYCFQIGGGTSTITIQAGYNLGSVLKDQSYTSSLATGMGSSFVWSLETGSTLPPGLYLGPGGTLIGTPTATGVYTFLVRASDPVITDNFGVKQFLMNVTPLTVAVQRTASYANVETPYTITLMPLGNQGTVTWSLSPNTPLPPGMTFDPLTGIVTGTPTSTGFYSHSAVVSDPAGGTSRTFSFGMQVFPFNTPPPLGINISGNLGMFTVGPITRNLQGSGGYPPYTYSYTPGAPEIPGVRVQSGQPLPMNFSVSPNGTGGLLGVFTTPGAYTTSIRVTDSHQQTFDRAFELGVSPIMPLSNTSLPRATVGLPYSFTFKAIGGTLPYRWSTGGTLPPGLSLTQEGLLSGTPTLARSSGFSFNARVDDTAGNFVSLSVNLEVNPFEITTAGVLPQGTVGALYSTTLAANASGVTWSMYNSGLPGGFSLDSATGEIRGTSSSPWAESFMVQARDSGGGTSRKTFSFRILPVSPTPLVDEIASQDDYVVGRTFAECDDFTDGIPPYELALALGSTLPPGLELVTPGETVWSFGPPGRHCLSGRPTTAGDFPFALRVTDSASPVNGTATYAVNLHVAPVSVEYEYLPNTGGPNPLTPLVYNTAYTQPMLGIGGTGAYTWAAEGTMPPGLALSPAGIVSGTPAETGSWDVEMRLTAAPGETILRNVNFWVSSGTAATLNIDNSYDFGTFSQGGTINRDLFVSGSPLPTPNYTFSAEDTLPAGCGVVSGDALLSGIPGPGRLVCNMQSAGIFYFRLRVQDGAGNFGVKRFKLSVTANNIFTGTNALYNAATGVSFSQRLIAWGDPEDQNWSVTPGSSLPGWLTLDPDGTLHGTPTATGPSSFNLRLTDDSGLFVSRSFNLTVASFAITTPGLIPVHAITGEPYSYQLMPTGLNWLLAPNNSLPFGFSLSSGGLLSGQSASEGIYTFDIQATDGSTTFTRRFSLVVRNKYSMLRSGASPTILGYPPLGLSFSTTLVNMGGVPPYTWTPAPGSSLPDGLKLISGSDVPANYPAFVTLLAGKPTVAGPYTFTLRLADSAGNSIERTFSLNVSPLGFPNAGPRAATRNAPYSQALTTMGGTPPYTYAMTGGFLPPGFTLSSGGLISGTTTNTGSWSFQTQVTDAAGHTRPGGFSVFVQGDGATQQQTVNVGSGPDFGSRSAGIGVRLSLNANGGTGPYTWDVSSGALPPGISLVNGAAIEQDPNTFYLSGRATTPGLYTFTLRATDSSSGGGRQGYRTCTLRISAMQVLSYAVDDWHQVFTGTPVDIRFTVVGGTQPYTFALPFGGAVPLGLTLNPNGTITGAAQESGQYTFSIVVTDAAGDSLTRSFGLVVWQSGSTVPLIVEGLDFETSPASVNSAYLSILGTEVGNPPYTIDIPPGSLPPGTTLLQGASSYGAYLVGAPSTVGDYTYGALVTDSAGQTLTVQISTHVSPLSLSPDPLPSATVGTPYSVTFIPGGGTAPYSLQLLPQSDLPPGLTLSGMTLSGTPTTPGEFDINLRLLDADGHELVRNYEDLSHLYVDSAVTPVKALSSSPANVQVTIVSGSSPAPVPINISSGFASVDFTATLAGITGASLSAASGTTPQALSLQLPGSLVAGTYYGVMEINTPQAQQSPLGIRVVVNVIPPPPCSYAVSPDTASIGAGGGSGSLNVSSPSYCSWSPTASQPWIDITSYGSGSGNDTVTYNLSSNPGTNPRTGTITVGGQVHSITQFGSTCSFTIDPANLAVPAAGGNGTIAVNASLGSCSWTATSNAGWIQVTSGSSGTGSGSVGLHVDASGASPRSGTVTIAALTLTVDQTGSGCVVSLSSGGTDMTSSGGPGSVNVTTNGCAYSTVEGPSWIAVTSGGSGSGSGTLNYSVAPNSTTQTRSGSLLIGGQPYQIVQAGEACSITLTSENPVFGAGGGSGTIMVAPNGSNCGWTSSRTADWLTITSGSSGKGNGQVNFNVSSTSSSLPRSGSIVVAGQIVPVNQSGVACSFDLRSSSGSVPATGGIGSTGVVSAAGCAWGAASNAAWLSITSSTGSGTGDVVYTAQTNPTGQERIGTLTIASQTYTVTQPGAPCAYTLSSSSITVAQAGAAGTFNFTANQSGCSPAAVSFAGWVSVSTSFGGTSGTVTYTAAPNPLASIRSGTIQLGEKIFTVNQLAASCAFSLNAYGAIYNSAGGSGDVLASASAAGCSPAVGYSPELTLGLLSQDPATLIWTQPYAVPAFDSLNNWIRKLEITMGGGVFTIKQTSWQ